MERRYQVFVSSTYEDLVRERQEVMQALLELDCIPSGMELFPAADDDQWTLIKKVIQDCDYYIVIIGGRYGTLAASGKSYTQMEYEYAVSQGKPVIAFLHRDPESILVSKAEKTERGKKGLEEFLALAQRKVCKYWSTPSELGSVVSRSLVKLIKTNPAVGWVRADLVPDETASQEILKAKKRIEELEQSLEKARSEAPKGTEDLAQGDEELDIHFTYTSSNDFTPDLVDQKATVTTTWNDIFFTLSPLMIDEASERSLKEALTTFVRDSTAGQLKPFGLYSNKIIRYSVSDEDFQTIKIQFRALGLTRKNDKQRSVKDTETYWSLTPYGDNVMTKLRAVRRQIQPPVKKRSGSSVRSRRSR